MANGQKQTGYAMVLSVGAQTLGIGRDVTLNRSATEIDATTRGGNGWREKFQGLKEWSVDAEAVWIPDDAGYLVLQNAFDNGTAISVSLTDVDGNEDAGSAFVTDMTRPEPLDDVVSVTVTLVGDGPLVFTPNP